MGAIGATLSAEQSGGILLVQVSEAPRFVTNGCVGKAVTGGL